MPTNFASMPGPFTNPCTQGPGIYNVDYRVGNNVTCTLQPGLYVFTGVLSLNNTSKLLGTGVSMYFTCRTGAVPRPCNSNGGAGESGGEFDARNGDVIVRAGAPPISNFVVAYDRSNNSNISLQGNGASVLGGDVYAVKSLLDANGGACHTVQGGSIIVNDIYLNGNPSCLNIVSGIPAVYIAPPAGLHLDQ